MDFITYYKLSNGYFRSYFNLDDTYTTTKYFSQEHSTFYLPSKQNYKINDEGLKQYAKDLIIMSDELATSDIFKRHEQPFHYIKPFIREDGSKYYRTHDKNIETLFIMITNNKKIDTFDDIDKIEANWMRKCYNAGLIYSIKGEHQSYGYDYSNFYGSLLASEEFIFPMKKGKEEHINKFPVCKTTGNYKIKTGFYNVKITSEDPNIKKVFSFSKYHVYCSTSLRHAFELQKKYKINIELITDVKYNAYTYKLVDLIQGYKLFNLWFNTILELKKEFPKNKLLKMLSSSLWGHLARKNIKTPSLEEAKDWNIGMSDNCDYYNLGLYDNYDGTEYYKLHNLNKPYKYKLGRIKCFLTALGRVKIANIIEPNINDVLRVHTDGICFNKEQILNIENFIPEEKTTGLLTFPIRRKYTAEEEDVEEY